MKPAIFAMMLSAASPALAQDKSGSFFDDFTTFNTERWYKSDGWSNGPHQSCTWSGQDVVAKDGMLELTMRIRQKGSNPYSCAEVQSRERFGFGMYEARIKGVAGSG